VGRVRRHRIPGLENGAEYAVRVRAVGADTESNWTDAAHVRIGPVEVVHMSGALLEISPGLMLRMFRDALVHLWSTR
jgi:hypothetical protein